MNSSCLTFPSLIVLSISLLTSAVSCKQDQLKDDTEAKKYFLTNDTMIYDEEIVNWKHDSARTIYKRGAGNNALDLDNSWLKYEMDGSFNGIVLNGIAYNGNWELIDGGGKIKINYLLPSLAEETYQVVKLNKDTFEWYDPSRTVFFRLVKK